MKRPSKIKFSDRFLKQESKAGLQVGKALEARLLYYPLEPLLLPNGIGIDVVLASDAHDQVLSCIYFFESVADVVNVISFVIHRHGRNDLDMMCQRLGLKGATS